MAWNLKTGGHTCSAKWSAVWESVVLVEPIVDAFDLLVFKVILGVIQCTCLKMAFNSKTADHKAKRREIWD